MKEHTAKYSEKSTDNANLVGAIANVVNDISGVTFAKATVSLEIATVKMDIAISSLPLSNVTLHKANFTIEIANFTMAFSNFWQQTPTIAMDNANVSGAISVSTADIAILSPVLSTAFSPRGIPHLFL